MILFGRSPPAWRCWATVGCWEWERWRNCLGRTTRSSVSISTAHEGGRPTTRPCGISERPTTDNRKLTTDNGVPIVPYARLSRVKRDAPFDTRGN
ncbi:protein of unknown function [Candidatus Nitrospira inopinata]|uniref:Uncharacterized protein n=1 Tax=Candidatus Nitrospira inopinata TaxID=1715989 RepID=A0A0S4KMF4_9BACT|nr:protein of unknown function [Candidatus Nitrospira inopinata]